MKTWLQTNAKLADQLGLHMWKENTKQGATIQTAVDYLMTLEADSEDVEEALPHVAAIAAAYGDPSRRYEAFLQQIGVRHKKKRRTWISYL